MSMLTDSMSFSYFSLICDLMFSSLSVCFTFSISFSLSSSCMTLYLESNSLSSLFFSAIISFIPAADSLFSLICSSKASTSFTVLSVRERYSSFLSLLFCFFSSFEAILRSFSLILYSLALTASPLRRTSLDFALISEASSAYSSRRADISLRISSRFCLNVPIFS